MSMNIKIKPRELFGEVAAIASKSFAHRMLICAAFADKPTKILCNSNSEDILATIGCLRKLGAKIKVHKAGFLVTPVRDVPAAVKIDCGESGSTLRFLLPVLGALGIKAEVKMRGRLPERPLSPLNSVLAQNGYSTERAGDTLLCRGRLSGENFTIAGDVSSQYISGLLLALPLLNGGQIRVTGDFQSKPYVDITQEILTQFGVQNSFENGVYSVGEKYTSPGEVTVEGDWSNAAFFLTAGALSSKGVTVTGLNVNSCQGDRKIVELLEEFGADVQVNENSVTVKSAVLRGITVDASDIPDLVPILSVVAAVARGKTVIKNAGRLRIKESDRLKAVSETLANMGADIRETEDGLVITGKPTLTGGKVHSFGDHRIVMSAAIASIKCGGKVKIRGWKAVEKSYPRFFDDFNVIGGKACNITADLKADLKEEIFFAILFAIIIAIFGRLFGCNGYY